jgi:hypothetical protein
MAKSYIVVRGGSWQPTRVQSVPAAAAVAARAERHARSTYGAGAGCDCYLVAETPTGLDFRGLIVGRRVIGSALGCGAAVIAKAANWAASVAAA